MRWRFIDQKNLSEVAERRLVIEKIESWWREFQAKIDDIQALFSQKVKWDLPEWMELHLQTIHPRLMWEFGPAVQGKGHRLVITPESDHHLRPLVRAILKQAPIIEGWEFYEYRLPEDLEVTQLTVEGRVGRQVTDLKVRAVCGEGNRIDLSFTAPSITSPEDRLAAQAAFVLTESVLGEQCLNNWIGGIEVIPWPRPTGLKSLLGFATKEIPHFLDLGRMKETVDALIGCIQEQLPPKPHFEWVETAGWTMWELKPKQSDDYYEQTDLFVGKSANPDQWTAAHSGQLFCSERFSRCNETFCYVKVDGSQGLEDGFADKSEIEDALNEVLKSKQLGCCMGGGTGNRYSYIDLAVTDVEQAIQAVRLRLQSGKIPKRSWIQFYDSDLATEWVGIYDDTPPPRMPPVE